MVSKAAVSGGVGRKTKHEAADPAGQVVRGLPREEAFRGYPEPLLAEAAKILLNPSVLL